MANVTQKVTSYVHGISLQPDHLKRPGQVKDLINGLPDVTFGLVKRPGSEIIKDLSTVKEGKWFHILRDDNEKYIGQYVNGDFKLWNLNTGAAQTIRYNPTADLTLPVDGGTSLPPGNTNPNPVATSIKDLPYLDSVDPDDLEFLTINDYTFITNKAKVTALSSASDDLRPYEAFVSINQIEYNSEYTIDLTEPDAAQVDEWRATSLSVSPSRWHKRDDNGMAHVANQIFTESSGTKTGLRFTLTTQGWNTSVPGYYDETSYNTTIRLNNGGKGWRIGDSVNVTMAGKGYTITVTGESKSTGYVSLASAYHLTPADSSSGSISANDILSDFKAQIEMTPGFTCEVIGSGLYIKSDTKFQIYGTGGRTNYALEAFTHSVNDISKLPSQCKDGYIVRVKNSAADEDDYYLKFTGNEEGSDGAGTWEETVKPGIATTFDYQTMPHQLVRMPDGTFMLSPVDWEPRLVGDEKTNPEPSFVGKTINKTLFYRNRLTFLSDENIIQSQSGDFFNFFVNTAMTVTDNDPIDLAASSTTPCELHDAVPMKVGLILFSRDKQFLYGTTNDILSPITAKIETMSTYQWNEHTPVVDMGVTLGFLSSSGEYSRFFEMTGIGSADAPEILEQSKIVNELLSSNLELIAQSKENTMLGFAERYARQGVFYRYFNDGSKRLLSSWFKWTFPGQLAYHFVDKDTYYQVLDVNGRIFLTQVNLSLSADDFVVSNTEVAFAPRLDLRSTIKKEDLTYDPVSNETHFTVPYSYASSSVVFGIKDGKIGDTIRTTVHDLNLRVKGDWTYTDLSIGYPYLFDVALPTVFMSKEEGEKVKSDTRMYLTVHRMKFQFADIGMFDTTVKRRGKPDYREVWEMSPGDHYRADTHEVLPTAFHPLPIYEKNLNTTVYVSSYHPTPASLLSMEWEGRISPKSYKSV